MHVKGLGKCLTQTKVTILEHLMECILIQFDCYIWRREMKDESTDIEPEWVEQRTPDYFISRRESPKKIFSKEVTYQC